MQVLTGLIEHLTILLEYIDLCDSVLYTPNIEVAFRVESGYFVLDACRLIIIAN